MIVRTDREKFMRYLLIGLIMGKIGMPWWAWTLFVLGAVVSMLDIFDKDR